MAPVWIAILACLALSLAAECQTPTTTTLVPAPNPSVYGQQVTLTATVTPSAATGTVTFYDGAASLGSDELDSGTATISTSSLSAGDHTLTAVYPGDGTTYDPSESDPVTQTVDKADTTVSVSSSKGADPAVTGESVTFTAAVSAVGPGSGTPTGTVDFYTNGELVLAGVDLDGAGEAECSRSFTHIEGPVDVVAYYSGDANFDASDNALDPLTQVVDKASTATAIDASADSWAGELYAVTGTVTVTGNGTGTPTGTVTVSDDNGETCAANLDAAALWSCSLSSAAGTRTLTAVYEGDENYAGSTGSTTHDANTVTTTLALTDDPDPSVIGEAVTLTATVTAASGGGSPTGAVTFIIEALSLTLGGAVLADSGTDESEAVLVTTEIPIGTHTITATYPGEGRFEGSTGTTQHTVNKRTTVTTVFVSDTPLVVGGTATGTVRVEGVPTNYGAPPIGDVTLSWTGDAELNGDSSPTVTHTLTAAEGGYFEFTYTPTDATTTPQIITATYEGDDVYNGSSDGFSQSIEKRTADLVMTISAPSAYVLEPVDVHVCVKDYSSGTLPISYSSMQVVLTTATPGAGEGEFDDASSSPASRFVADLDANGCWTGTYTPAAFETGPDGTAAYLTGVTTLTATFASSADAESAEEAVVYDENSVAESLTVNLRPVKTTVQGSDDILLVWEKYTFSCTVVDGGPTASAVDPEGTVTFHSSLPSYGGTAWINPASGTLPSVNPDPCETFFGYMCLTLPGDAGYDLVEARYEATDGIHADGMLALQGSIGAFQQPLQRRPTVTQVSGGTCAYVSPTLGQISGVTAIVKEDPSNAHDDLHGDAAIPIAGSIVVAPDWTPAPAVVSCVAPKTVGCTSSPFTINVVPTPPATTLSPTTNVTVQYEPNDMAHLKSTGSANYTCADWVPIIPPTDENNDGSDCDDGCGDGGRDIENAIYALNSTVVALNAVKMALDVAAIVCDVWPDPVVVAGIGVSTGSTIPTSDIAAAIVAGVSIALDIAITAMETDLDGDGIPDSAETTLIGSDPYKWDTDGDGMGDLDEIDEAGGYFGGTRRPSPLVADSDLDGISDGDEANLSHTDFCVADTDCDTVSDGAEYATWEPPLNPTMEIRDQADPLMEDTDGDGLRDDIEIAAGCPYVNDDDSDDDGLQDGYEDADSNGIVNSIGNSLLQGSGETDYCVADTDGDGLLDGEEEGLFGAGEVTPKGVSPSVGTEGADLGITVPALDSDMDNDGLTDYEEVNLFQTDPMDADTDDDMVSDGAEIATWDDVIAARLGVSSSSDSRDHANPREDDTDGDGLTDNLEFAYGCNCGTGTDGYVNDDDSDDDGLQDGREYQLFGTGADVLAANSNDGELYDDAICCLCDPDSDGDGLSDGEEVHTGTDPLDWDSDDDGLSDLEELQVYFTDPNDPDTDDDNAKGILLTRPAAIALAGYPAASSYANIGLESDGEEALSRTGVAPFGYLGDQSDPLQKDTDGDGIQDDIEFAPGCNCGANGAASKDGFVNDDDSDDDGLQDGLDSELHLAAWDAADWGKDVTISTGNDGELHDDFVCAICDYDSDGDGLSDGEEVHIGTNPLDWDSDDDGLSDLEELQVYLTDPNNDDTDGDGADGNIAARDPAISPQLSGHSGNGTIAALSDCEEAFSGTSYPPFGDPLDETDPLQVDTDGDGLDDAIEFKVGCSCATTEWCDCPAAPWAYADPNYYGVAYDPMRDGYANSFDSDGDGLRDDLDIGADVAPSNGNDGELNDDDTHSICDYDSDGDGLSDGEEYHTGTDWLDWDSDDDGLSDYEEVRTYFTDPNDDDTDDDQAEGNIAARVPTIEPRLLGHSGSGTIVTLSDCEEAFSGTGYPPFGNPFDETDPLQVDTDGDGLTDAVEFKVGCSCATTDWCDCPAAPWVYADPNYYGVVYDPLRDGYANSSDSDEDGLRDGEDIHEDLDASAIDFPGKVFTRRAMYIYPDEVWGREQRDDGIHSICDRDSDGDGLLDGEEFAIGTDWLDWDTDDDGRNDWHEHTGGEQWTTGTDPIPSDPFDPDTDDDGLLDSAEVFGSNNTNVLNADTDGDGLCDGGTGTPYMMDWFLGDTSVLVNPLCKSCATPGLSDCGATSARTGSLSGIGDHPNRLGFGEDQDGNGAWDSGETDPNQYDTDGDAIADGIERLSFSTSRLHMIPPQDLLGRPILVTYPEANNIQDPCGCLDPLNLDSDGDGLSDGYEDQNHDGNFDFLPSDFDIFESSVETSLPDPEETNPCVADTDGDGLSDWEERFQRQPLLANPPLPLDNDGDGLLDEDPVDGMDNDLDGKVDEDPAEGPYELTFNPTNPLDWDTDNDWLSDGEEVHWECVAIEYSTLDNDTDGLIDEDPIDGLDNDGDGLIDEDPVDFWVRFVPMLDPTMRDSDSDGYIDGLDEDPCNSELLPLVEIPVLLPVDTDGDGFADDDEEAAGTHPNSADDHPAAYCAVDVDFDDQIDDRIWLEPGACCGEASAVVFDLDCNVLIDLRIAITSRSLKRGDFDGDGYEDDLRYTVEYILSNYRTVQLRGIATIDDYNCDLVIDWVIVERK